MKQERRRESTTAMTEVKAAIIGFLAGGFVASAMFMVMRRGEQDKKTKAARKHVFIKDEGASHCTRGLHLTS